MTSLEQFNESPHKEWLEETITKLLPGAASEYMDFIQSELAAINETSIPKFREELRSLFSDFIGEKFDEFADRLIQHILDSFDYFKEDTTTSQQPPSPSSSTTTYENDDISNVIMDDDNLENMNESVNDNNDEKDYQTKEDYNSKPKSDENEDDDEHGYSDYDSDKSSNNSSSDEDDDDSKRYSSRSKHTNDRSPSESDRYHHYHHHHHHDSDRSRNYNDDRRYLQQNDNRNPNWMNQNFAPMKGPVFPNMNFDNANMNMNMNPWPAPMLGVIGNQMNPALYMAFLQQQQQQNFAAANSQQMQQNFTVANPQQQQQMIQPKMQPTMAKRQSTSLYPNLTEQRLQQQKNEQEIEKKKRLWTEQLYQMQQQQQQQQQFNSITEPVINPSSTSMPSDGKMFHKLNNNINTEDNNTNWNGQNSRRARRRQEVEEDDEIEDPTKEASTLLLVAVPPEKNNDKEIKAFFSKFGKINSTESWVGQRKAFVKFNTRAEAELAFRSKCAIFDDRNVKIVMERESTRDKPKKFSIYVPKSRPTVPQNPPGLDLSSRDGNAGDDDEIASPNDYDGSGSPSADGEEGIHDDDVGSDGKSEPPPTKKVRITGITSTLFSSIAKSSKVTDDAISPTSTIPPQSTSKNQNVKVAQTVSIKVNEEDDKVKRSATELKKKIAICKKLMESYPASNDVIKKTICEKVAKTIMEVDIVLWPSGRPKSRPQLPDKKTPTPSSPPSVFEATLNFIDKELTDAVERPEEHRKFVEDAKAEMAERHRLAEQQKKFLSQVSVFSPKLPDNIRTVESIKATFKGVKKVLFYSDTGKISSVISFYNHNYAESVK